MVGDFTHLTSLETLRLVWGLQLLTGLIVRFDCASSGWCLGIWVWDMHALVTSLGLQGEPQGHSMARGQGPALPYSGGSTVTCGLGGEQTHRSLVGTFRTSLWRELASVRGTDKMTTFGENERGPQKHCASRHVPAKHRQEETVPGALGLPRKMYLSFKKEKQHLVSAAGTAEDPSRSCGTTAQALSEGGQPAAMDQSQNGIR